MGHMVSTELPPLARAESVLELADLDAAESLTQDCFLKAYNARHQFRGESSLSTWLTRIALNLVRDHLRSRRMRFWQRTRDTALDIVDVGEWIPDGASSPEQVCLQQERVREI